MYYFTITPLEAAAKRVSSPEEQLHEALNTLLYSLYSGSPATIYEEDVSDLLGPQWNLETHPRVLLDILDRYSSAGWAILEDRSNPHRRRWIFSALPEL